MVDENSGYELPRDGRLHSIKPQCTGVGSGFEDVIKYATVQSIHGPAIDLRRLEELEGRFGHNGGIGCDVLRGPCSCGAWH